MSFSAYLSRAACRVLDLKCSAKTLSPSSWVIAQDSSAWNPGVICSQHQQIRWRSAKKRRHTVQPFWHAQVTRTMHPEGITTENEEFVEETIKTLYESPLEKAPWPIGEWAPKSQRCGLIGKKLGSTIMWKKDGTKLLTTMIHISDNHVIRYIPASELIKNAHLHHVRLSKRPRGALLVGSDSADPRLFTKEYFNMFEEAGVMPKKKLTKFLVTDNAILQPGTPLHATHFRPGDYIDIAGFTTDHQGASGRSFMPLPASQTILRINSHYNVLWVLGKIPGAINDYVNLYDSGLLHHRYRDPDNHPPFPTHFPEEQTIEHVDWYAEDIHKFTDESIVFEEEGVA
ncbi:39S ribosomal protein L3, mitochondrial [Hyalella azteca]|uniref:Large ribosomal subunit protein uL3m n=1 Tax=Hyalella azteca TaxID=294128 RepID=A0A8B7NSJ9_HYAAZ|nr:39S ribosomal protein L3, mitochondrial [Hyalella azteca]